METMYTYEEMCRIAKLNADDRGKILRISPQGKEAKYPTSTVAAIWAAHEILARLHSVENTIEELALELRGPLEKRFELNLRATHIVVIHSIISFMREAPVPNLDGLRLVVAVSDLIARIEKLGIKGKEKRTQELVYAEQ